MEYEHNPDDMIKTVIPEIYVKRILCIARICAQKRFDIFLEVAAMLPDYAFIWIGNQYDIKNTPVNVFCLGNIPNAGQYNQFVDIFMLPSNYEGLPVVIIEAMKYGKPVVASDVGGIREIVINGENGFTVKNNAVDFAEKISYILKDKQICQNFSQASLSRYNNLLTTEKMAQGYLEIYRS